MKSGTDGDSRQRASDELCADFAETTDPLEQLQCEWGCDLDRQRARKSRFAETTKAAARREAEAIEAAFALSLDPENEFLKRRHVMAKWQADLFRDQVEEGRRTYEANARAWYGGTRAELRPLEREAYAAMITETKGRAVRPYSRVSEMTLADQDAHRRLKEREKKARYRAAKANKGQ